jgi:hypothetical protein
MKLCSTLLNHFEDVLSRRRSPFSEKGILTQEDISDLLKPDIIILVGQWKQKGLSTK